MVDFWEMIVEQGSEVIVMLADSVEDGRVSIFHL
jgi:protein tyrosine phosphatase